jgi:hypothetical protein
LKRWNAASSGQTNERILADHELYDALDCHEYPDFDGASSRGSDTGLKSEKAPKQVNAICQSQSATWGQQTQAHCYE